MKEFILGQVAFVILSTGSGKSLIFQAFPVVMDPFEENQSSHQSIAVVISPVVYDMSYLIFRFSSFSKKKKKKTGNLIVIFIII